jgi:hypothetical protein
VNVLTPEQVGRIEDLELFNKCARYHGLMQSPLWGELKEHLADITEEALSDLRRSMSDDPKVTHNLKLRWQQRDAVCKDLVNFVEGNSAYYIQKVQELNSQESEEWQPQP